VHGTAWAYFFLTHAEILLVAILLLLLFLSKWQVE